MRSTWTAPARLLWAAGMVASAIILSLRVRNGVETELLAMIGQGDGLTAEVRALSSGTAMQGRVLIEGRDFVEVKGLSAECCDRLGVTPGDFGETVSFLAAHSAGLISTETRELLLNGRFKDVADASVARLYGFVPPILPVKVDPFLLGTDWLMSLGGMVSGGWSLREGLLVREDGKGCSALMSFDLSSVPQEKCAAFLSWAEEQNVHVSSWRIWCGGAPFHSSRTALRARREINALSVVSLVLTVLFGFMLFRTIRFIPSLLFTLASAFLVGSAALYAVFPRPHVLTFVFGTSLAGLAVDYVYHARMAGGAKRIARPLSMALLTTIICFVPLFFAPSVALRQMALFTAAGLLAAYACVWAWPWPEVVTDGGDVRQSSGGGTSGGCAIWWRVILGVLVVAGVFRLRMTASPTAFYRPDPYLAQSERRIAECVPSSGGRLLFTRGSTLQEALEREEEAGVPGLSAIVPSLRRQRENKVLAVRLKEVAGTEYSANTGMSVESVATGELLDPLKIPDSPLRRMVFSMIAPGGTVVPCPPGFEVRSPHVEIVDPKKLVEDMFASFTSAALACFGYSLALIPLVLAALFRRRVFRLVLPIGAAFAMAAGILGWLGVPITCFTPLCLLALAGLGIDYAIFRSEATADETLNVRRTVLFSFLTSLAGLGMLSFTDFAVTRSMGVTFACGLVCCWLCSPLAALDWCHRRVEEGDVAWHMQREQSAGIFRLRLMWFVYSFFGKGFMKALCVPVMAFIFPFARPARDALREFYGVLGIKASSWKIFRHLLGFTMGLADKTDVCTLRKSPPKVGLRDDVGGRAFMENVTAGRGAFLVSSHLGVVEMMSALPPPDGRRAPHLHAFQQMGHDAVFTNFLMERFASDSFTLHAVESIGVETAVRMQEAIGRGELVLMAGDRVSAGSGKTVERMFLGRLCRWPKGVFAFARLMECPVFFVTCVRTGRNRYEVHFAQAAQPHADDRHGDGMLSEYVAFLEAETRTYPDQWHHFHRFFGTPGRLLP